VSDATVAQLQQLLMTEFESRGWDYDLTVGAEIVRHAEQDNPIDAPALAASVSNTWLERNGATREDVVESIERAIGARTLRVERPPATILNVDNRSYSLGMGPGAQIANSQLNVGGTQVNVRVDAAREDVLAGVAALVRAGFAGSWNPEAARDLSQLINSRSDIGLADIEAVATEVARTEPNERTRLRRILESIATQGLSGALATGITTVIGSLLAGHLF